MGEATESKEYAIQGHVGQADLRENYTFQRAWLGLRVTQALWFQHCMFYRV
jgi:hypothetical protein